MFILKDYGVLKCPLHNSTNIVFICLDNQCKQKGLCNNCIQEDKKKEHEKTMPFKDFLQKLHAYSRETDTNKYDSIYQSVVNGWNLGECIQIRDREFNSIVQPINDQINEIASNFNQLLTSLRAKITNMVEEDLEFALSHDILKIDLIKKKACLSILDIAKKKNHQTKFLKSIQNLHRGRSEINISLSEIQTVTEIISQKLIDSEVNITQHIDTELNKLVQKVKSASFKQNYHDLISEEENQQQSKPIKINFAENSSTLPKSKSNSDLVKKPNSFDYRPNSARQIKKNLYAGSGSSQLFTESPNLMPDSTPQTFYEFLEIDLKSPQKNNRSITKQEKSSLINSLMFSTSQYNKDRPRMEDPNNKLQNFANKTDKNQVNNDYYMDEKLTLNNNSNIHHQNNLSTTNNNYNNNTRSKTQPNESENKRNTSSIGSALLKSPGIAIQEEDDDENYSMSDEGMMTDNQMTSRMLTEKLFKIDQNFMVMPRQQFQKEKHPTGIQISQERRINEPKNLIYKKLLASEGQFELAKPNFNPSQDQEDKEYYIDVLKIDESHFILASSEGYLSSWHFTVVPEISGQKVYELQAHAYITCVCPCKTPGLFLTSGGQMTKERGVNLKMWVFQDINTIVELADLHDIHKNEIITIELVQEKFIERPRESTQVFTNVIFFATIAKFEKLQLWSFSFHSSCRYKGQVVSLIQIDVRTNLKQIIFWDYCFWGISENSIFKWKISTDLTQVIEQEKRIVISSTKDYLVDIQSQCDVLAAVSLMGTIMIFDNTLNLQVETSISNILQAAYYEKTKNQRTPKIFQIFNIDNDLFAMSLQVKDQFFIMVVDKEFQIMRKKFKGSERFISKFMWNEEFFLSIEGMQDFRIWPGIEPTILKKSIENF